MRTSLSKPFSAKAKFLVLIMAFLFTLLLTACGSGSSATPTPGGITPTPGGVTPTTPTPGVSASGTPDVSASGDQLDRTSRARQTAGAGVGVVQSTNVDSSNASQDEFDTALTTDGDGNEVIRFTHTDTIGGLGVLTVDFKFSDAEYHTATEVTAAGIEFGSAHSSSVSFTEINDYEELGDDGYLWTDIYISNLSPRQEGIADDGDGSSSRWLLGGIWLYIPKSAIAGEYEIGAFVDTNNRHSETIEDSQATVGAVYKGAATGTFLAGKTTSGWAGGGYFDAKAALTATFTSGDGGDTIAGSIFDVEITEGYGSFSTTTGDIPTRIELGLANIGADGFYQGTTTSNESAGPHAGFWGGEFLDTGGSTTDTPETTGGTFSGSNVGVADDARASVFVGVFITTRD